MFDKAAYDADRAKSQLNGKVFQIPKLPATLLAGLIKSITEGDVATVLRCQLLLLL